jgi:phosphoglycerate dehydrogenase-like enzyme
MKTVLVNKPIHPDALKRLSEEVRILTPFAASCSELMDMLSGVQGVVLCLGLDFTAEVIDHCKAIEVIGRHGAGVETVDVEAASRRNIPVVFTPFGPTESTAEHAFMLMMATARKLSLTDERALVEALRHNKIAGASLDVYDPEPPTKDNPLFSLDNVVLTPHLASFTDEGRKRMGLTVVEDVLSVLRGDPPKYPLNPEVL